MHFSPITRQNRGGGKTLHNSIFSLKELSVMTTMNSRFTLSTQWVWWRGFITHGSNPGPHKWREKVDWPPTFSHGRAMKVLNLLYSDVRTGLFNTITRTARAQSYREGGPTESQWYSTKVSPSAHNTQVATKAPGCCRPTPQYQILDWMWKLIWL